MANFKRINTNNYELSRVQDNIAETVRNISNTPFQNGVFHEVDLSTSNTFLNHKLDRKYQGYIVVDKNADENIYTSATNNPRPNQQIILLASGNVRAKLYVF